MSVSVIVAAVLLVSAAPETAFRVAPACESQRRGEGPCTLCGMTHAFVAISRGRFSEAAGHNPAGVPLYAGLAGNEIIFGVVLLKRAARRRAHPPLEIPNADA
jgi:hypothetical protein